MDSFVQKAAQALVQVAELSPEVAVMAALGLCGVSCMAMATLVAVLWERWAVERVCQRGRNRY